TPGTGDALTVHGTVTRPDGTPVPQVLIKALDRNPGVLLPLGQAATDDRGQYGITYDAGALHQAGKDRADLKVQVWDPAADVLLVESPLILQALPDEVVNLVVGDERSRGPDEFSRIASA